jgi:hypothetical protein
MSPSLPQRYRDQRIDRRLLPSASDRVALCALKADPLESGDEAGNIADEASGNKIT